MLQVFALIRPSGGSVYSLTSVVRRSVSRRKPERKVQPMCAMNIQLERIYDDRHLKGYRVLVDRLWPRGVSKERAGLDEWSKVLSPSPALRKWFGHRPEHWEEFQRRYESELSRLRHEAQALLQRSGRRNLVLVYGARDKEHTHALVLRRYLQAVADGAGEEEEEAAEMASPVCYAAEFEKRR